MADNENTADGSGGIKWRRRAAAALLVVSFIIHGAVIFELRSEPAMAFFNANPAFDSYRFQQEADAITNNGFYASSEKRQQSPLYPMLVAGFSRLFGPYPAALLLFHALLNVAALYIVYRLAGEWFGGRAALAALFFGAFYQALPYHAVVFLRESPVLFLSALSALLCNRSAKGALQAVAAGVAVGLLTATRPYPLCAAAGLLWVVIEAGSPGRRAALRAACYLGGIWVVLQLLPGPKGGDALGGIAHFLSGNVLDGAYGYIWASTPEKERLLAASNGSYLTAAWLVMKEVGAHPAAYAFFYFKKLGMLVGDFEIPSNYNIYLFREELSRSLNFAFITFGMFAPFAAVGAAASGGSRRMAGFFIWTAAVLLGIFIFPIQERYRLMAAPLFLIMAGHGVAFLFGLAAAGEMRRVARYSAVFLAFLFLCRFDFSPLPFVVDAEDYSNLSLAYRRAGDDGRARYYRIKADQKAALRGVPLRTQTP